ncbi:MAG: hypothetical protein L3J56_00785 [Bacteroidales bacterium]|nr:hypothetical protein [Bacteroidales bacterium]
MKNLFKYGAAALILVSFIVGGCDKTQVVEPITPGGYGYATATFTTDFTGNDVTEGDTIKYMIKLDKALDRALTFTLKLEDGTADENDFSWQTVVISPYTKETEFDIIVVADDIPENTETAKIELGVFGTGDKNLLSPETVNPVLNLNIISVNDSRGVTVSFGWPDPNDDFDIFCEAEVGGSWALAASSADPETMPAMIWNDDPDDVYYVTVDPYSVESGDMIDYKIGIGYSDQTVEFVNGTFDYVNRDTVYPIIYFSYWGMNTYEVLKMEKNGTTLTISNYDGTLINTVTLPSPKKSQRNSVDLSQYIKKRK